MLIDPSSARFGCTIITSLPKGDIGAVTGGTGDFRNARGEGVLHLGLTSKALRGGRTVVAARRRLGGAGLTHDKDHLQHPAGRVLREGKMMRQAFAMNKVFKRLALPGTALAAVLLTLFASAVGANAQTAASGEAASTGWYLALGDSVATGYQPGLGDDPQGGYVGHVLQVLRASASQTQLRNLACDGETSITFVSGGKCSYEEGSQLAQALVFLRAHSSTTRLVTVTIGGNDLTPCLTKADPATCAQVALGTLAANLQQSLASVHAAAPGAKIVVTNYYDPFLALWFTNSELATLSSTLQAALNDTIASITSGIGGATADVAAAFKSTDTTLIDGVPTNVATICQLTWMCTKNDDHPNDVGYAVIATAVVAKLS